LGATPDGLVDQVDTAHVNEPGRTVWLKLQAELDR